MVKKLCWPEELWVPPLYTCSIALLPFIHMWSHCNFKVFYRAGYTQSLTKKPKQTNPSKIKKTQSEYLDSLIIDHIHLVQKTQSSFPRQKYVSKTKIKTYKQYKNQWSHKQIFFQILAAQRSFSQVLCDNSKPTFMNMPRHRVGILSGSLECMAK